MARLDNATDHKLKSPLLYEYGQKAFSIWAASSQTLISIGLTSIEARRGNFTLGAPPPDLRHYCTVPAQ